MMCTHLEYINVTASLWQCRRSSYLFHGQDLVENAKVRALHINKICTHIEFVYGTLSSFSCALCALFKLVVRLLRSEIPSAVIGCASNQF